MKIVDFRGYTTLAINYSCKNLLISNRRGHMCTRSIALHRHIILEDIHIHMIIDNFFTFAYLIVYKKIPNLYKWNSKFLNERDQQLLKHEELLWDKFQSKYMTKIILHVYEIQHSTWQAIHCGLVFCIVFLAFPWVVYFQITIRFLHSVHVMCAHI